MLGEYTAIESALKKANLDKKVKQVIQAKVEVLNKAVETVVEEKIDK